MPQIWLFRLVYLSKIALMISQYLEVSNVNHIKSNKGGEKSNVSLCDGVTSQETWFRQDRFYLYNNEKINNITYYRIKVSTIKLPIKLPQFFNLEIKAEVCVWLVHNFGMSSMFSLPWNHPIWAKQCATCGMQLFLSDLEYGWGRGEIVACVQTPYFLPHAEKRHLRKAVPNRVIASWCLVLYYAW